MKYCNRKIYKIILDRKNSRRTNDKKFGFGAGEEIEKSNRNFDKKTNYY